MIINQNIYGYVFIYTVVLKTYNSRYVYTAYDYTLNSFFTRFNISNRKNSYFMYFMKYSCSTCRT